MAGVARRRLDAELVRRKLARSREHAGQLIAAGRVTVGKTLATKPATQVETAAAIVVTRDDSDPDYVSRGCGMGRDATLYLLQRGVRVTGTDGWSWDAPFVHTAKRFAETRDASLIWEGHRAGMEIGYCHIEKLHNLEALPPT